MDWNIIREHADEARSHFLDNVDGRVDILNGYYHLFTAWKMAESEEVKDELTWARILRMLAENIRDCFFFDDYEKYKRFALPMLEAYKRAKEQGAEISGEELRGARMLLDRLDFWTKTHRNSRESGEESLILIKNMESLKDRFEIHNSKPVLFSHDEKSAELIIDDGEYKVTLLFTGVWQIEVAPMDPLDCWIEHFSILKSELNGMLTCEIGEYTILCGSVELKDVEKHTEVK